MNSLKQEMIKEVTYQINNFNCHKINNIISQIQSCNGIVYFTGVGKSANSAKHCCDLLKSISIKTFYINILNILHGDIGTLCSNDIIFFFSKSGNTCELITVVPILKAKGVNIITICCEKNSKLKSLSNTIYEIPFKQEISGNINMIPTNSIMGQLLFSNFLVSILKNDICVNQYKRNHYGGNIGTQLLTIKDIAIKHFPKKILNNKISLHKILLEMTKYKIGCCFFVNNKNELIGIITDGDIRRLLLVNPTIRNITINNINIHYISECDQNKYVSDIQPIGYIPIVQKKKLIYIIDSYKYFPTNNYNLQ